MIVKELIETLQEINEPNADVWIEHEVEGKVGSTAYEVRFTNYDYDSNEFVITFITDYKLVPKRD